MRRKKTAVWVVLTAILISSHFGFGQAAEKKAQDPEKTTKSRLAEMGIIPYPAASELEASPLPDGALKTTALDAEDIGADFSNFGDLSWLEPVAKKNKVVLLGENHYYEGIHNLCNRMLFALNTYDSYPLFLMELPYSVSPFLDHYVGLADDEEAKAFFKEVSKFAWDEEEITRLEHIRRWNKTHPARRIHVGTHDIEHMYKVTLKDILLPYFEANGRTWTIDVNKAANKEIRSLLSEMKTTNDGYKGKTVRSAYPFINPGYIECVIENMFSVLNSKDYEFGYYRQKGIARNMTDPRFHGKFFANSKVLIHAGSWHTPSKLPYPDGANFLRDGSYLNYDYGPTKGKVFSIRFEGLSYRLGNMADVDLDSCMPCGRGYRFNVTTMQKAYKEGLLSKDGFYRITGGESIPKETVAFYMMIYKAAYRNRQAPFVVDGVDWDMLLKAAGGRDSDLGREILRQKDDSEIYDMQIFVPQSDILTLRKKESAPAPR